MHIFTAGSRHLTQEFPPRRRGHVTPRQRATGGRRTTIPASCDLPTRPAPNDPGIYLSEAGPPPLFVQSHGWLTWGTLRNLSVHDHLVVLQSTQTAVYRNTFTSRRAEDAAANSSSAGCGAPFDGYSPKLVDLFCFATLTRPFTTRPIEVPRVCYLQCGHRFARMETGKAE
jgi:hypothetical protein